MFLGIVEEGLIFFERSAAGLWTIHLQRIVSTFRSELAVENDSPRSTTQQKG